MAKFEDFTAQAQAVDAEEEKLLAELRAKNPELFAEIAAATAPLQLPNYNEPEIIENILAGDPNAIQQNELYVKAYLGNVAESIGEACEGRHFTSREVDALRVRAVANTVEFTPEAGFNALAGLMIEMANISQSPAGMQNLFAQAAAAERAEEKAPIEAMKDGFTLVLRYGCGSSDLDKFKEGVVSFMENEGAPSMSLSQLRARCEQSARPTGRYDAKNFCQCFVPLVSPGPISRPDRIGLAKDFWPTAQRMMKANPGRFAFCNQ